MQASIFNSLEQLENGTVTDKIIEIKSIYKNGKTTVQPVRDPMSGWLKGVERLSENDKRDRTFWAEAQSKFVLKEGVIIDLNKEEHRVIWEWLKYQPCLAMSYEACQMRPAAEFYVHLKHKEAVKSVSRKKLKYKAITYITNDNASNYPLRVKLLGINMDGEDPLIIEDFLLERAESDPDRIIKLYTDKFLGLRMLLMEAVEKRKVIVEPSGAYRYGTMFLGMTEDSAIDWMNSSENASVVKMMQQEVNPEYFSEVEGDEDTAAEEPEEEIVEKPKKVFTAIKKPAAKKATTATKKTVKKSTK